MARAALKIIPLCQRGDRVGIERQLEEGADIQEVDVEGNTPLHVACEAPRNEIAVLQTVLEAGANVNANNFNGLAPLHFVCLRKSNVRGVLNLLLENGAEINCQSLSGRTPLHFAAERDMHELVEALLVSGADPNLGDNEGNTAVHLVLLKEGGRDTVKRQILESLAQYDAILSAANREGLTPGLIACRGGYVRCLQLLFEKGAEMRALTPRWESGLQLACAGAHPESVQLMLQAFPECVDEVDNDGNTALHRCAAIGSLECAMLLLKAGAKPTLKNNAKQTPIDLGKSRGNDLSDCHNPELLVLLNEHKGSGGCPLQ